MSISVQHFEKVCCFLEEYQLLIDSHLVDFVTKDLWSRCLPSPLREELENLGLKSISIRDLNGRRLNTPQFHEFLNTIELLSLEKCTFVYESADLPELLSKWGIENTQRIEICNKKLEYMNNKKSYEVIILARIVSSLAKFHASLIIDAGAGKGYLSNYLSQNYGIPVLAVDSSDITHEGAIRRQRIMKKKTGCNANLVCHRVQHIDESTDFSKLSRNCFPMEHLSENLTITGLHTCGSLSNTAIKSMVSSDSIKSLCVVPCCYHLAETSFAEHLTLSKNAKMLAQQSVHRACQQNYSLSPSLHYRAVLQTLLHSLGMQDVKLGRGAPLDNFAMYATWALRKMGSSCNQIPTADVLEKLYTDYEMFEVKLELFQMMRIHLGRVVESAILLDKIIYLEKSKVCSKLALVRLFDPLVSPRCYGIIALK